MKSTATVADSLTVHGGLYDNEIADLIEHWAPLDARMRSFDAGTVRLDLYLKDRDRPGQHATLEAHIERFPPLVATADERDLPHLLNTLRDEMIRLMRSARDQRDPRHHRR